MKLYDELNPAQKLAIQCLAFKWNRLMDNRARIHDFCPFCYDTGENLECRACKCSPTICSHGSGLFSEMSMVSYPLTDKVAYRQKFSDDGYKIFKKIYRKIVNEFARMLERC